jgi:GntR family transcriptional regulator, vanillate catabolism transcriptional regulator
MMTMQESISVDLSTSSAAVRALLQLRELIVSGELAGGMRIAELSIVERLGVSRTPVRAALATLAHEGLIEVLPSGGYAVKSFTEHDIADAIELRGTLEGLLARTAAERGVSPIVLGDAKDCLHQIDATLALHELDDEAFSEYVALNERFHGLLSELANSSVLAQQLERVVSLPFASASAFVLAQANSVQARDMLIVAQDQHWQVLDAIERREGARAEAIMREHSRLAQRNLRRALLAHAKQEQGDPPALKAIRLIRRIGAER